MSARQPNIPGWNASVVQFGGFGMGIRGEVSVSQSYMTTPTKLKSRLPGKSLVFVVKPNASNSDCTTTHLETLPTINRRLVEFHQMAVDAYENLANAAGNGPKNQGTSRKFGVPEKIEQNDGTTRGAIELKKMMDTFSPDAFYGTKVQERFVKLAIGKWAALRYFFPALVESLIQPLGVLQGSDAMAAVLERGDVGSRVVNVGLSGHAILDPYVGPDVTNGDMIFLTLKRVRVRDPTKTAASVSAFEQRCQALGLNPNPLQYRLFGEGITSGSMHSKVQSESHLRSFGRSTFSSFAVKLGTIVSRVNCPYIVSPDAERLQTNLSNGGENNNCDPNSGLEIMVELS